MPNAFVIGALSFLMRAPLSLESLEPLSIRRFHSDRRYHHNTHASAHAHVRSRRAVYNDILLIAFALFRIANVFGVSDSHAGGHAAVRITHIKYGLSKTKCVILPFIWTIEFRFGVNLKNDLLFALT